MKINENYRVEVESNGGVVLIFSETRTRKDGKDKGKEYLFEDKWYYNNIQSALKSYLLKTLEDSRDVKNCIELIKQSMLKIESLTF